MQIIKLLQDALKNGYPGGICSAIRRSDLSFKDQVKARDLMLDIIKELKYYSGDITYPILPRNIKHHKAYEAYIAYTEASKSGLWSTETKYGRRRRKVTLRLIEELRKWELPKE